MRPAHLTPSKSSSDYASSAAWNVLWGASCAVITFMFMVATANMKGHNQYQQIGLTLIGALCAVGVVYFALKFLVAAMQAFRAGWLEVTADTCCRHSEQPALDEAPNDGLPHEAEHPSHSAY